MGQPWPGNPAGQQPYRQPQQGHPGQAPYPSQPAGYPSQPTGHPQQFPGHPPAYPQQPYPGGAAPGMGPGFGAPGPVPGGPLTVAGWGALPAALGVVMTFVGMFALPWASAMGNSVWFLDLWEATDWEMDLRPLYVVCLSFVLLAVLPLAVLPWTLGALRTDRSARWLSGILRNNLSRRTFVKYRVVFAGRAFAATVLHGMGIAYIFKGDFEASSAGPWVLLAGCLLTVVGALVGPRKGPGLPQTSM
ncbi:hypothetical protein [Saccharomonospora cyanea]|nr:hypothetical protein [Saccharomonospora cyanea]